MITYRQNNETIVVMSMAEYTALTKGARRKHPKLTEQQNAHWNDEDRSLMQTLYKRGVPPKDIAKTLQRTPGAIYNEISRLKKQAAAMPNAVIAVASQKIAV